MDTSLTLLFSLNESGKFKTHENRMRKVHAVGVDYSLLISVKGLPEPVELISRHSRNHAFLYAHNSEKHRLPARKKTSREAENCIKE